MIQACAPDIAPSRWCARKTPYRDAEGVQGDHRTRKHRTWRDEHRHPRRRGHPRGQRSADPTSRAAPRPRRGATLRTPRDAGTAHQPTPLPATGTGYARASEVSRTPAPAVCPTPPWSESGLPHVSRGRVRRCMSLPMGSRRRVKAAAAEGRAVAGHAIWSTDTLDKAPSPLLYKGERQDQDRLLARRRSLPRCVGASRGAPLARQNSVMIQSMVVMGYSSLLLVFSHHHHRAPSNLRDSGLVNEV